MTETLLNRISKHPNDTIVSDAWLTGQTGEIVDLLGNNEFRFIDYIDSPELRLKHTTEESKLSCPVVACGLVGYWLHKKDSEGTKAIFEGYYDLMLKEYEKAHLGDDDAWERDFKKEFVCRYHIPREKKQIRTSEAIFAYITESDQKKIKSITDNYLKFARTKRKQLYPPKHPANRMIEDTFLDAYRMGGPAYECMSWMRTEYNLPHMGQHWHKGRKTEKEQLPGKWKEHHERVIPEYVAESYEDFDDSVLKYTNGGLMDEIDENIKKCQTREDRIRYIISLLQPFKEFAEAFYAKAQIDERKRSIDEHKKWIKDWEAMPDDAIDERTGEPIRPKDQISACEETIEEYNQDIEYWKKVQEDFFWFAQHGLGAGHYREYPQVVNDEMCKYLGGWWECMIFFARRLAALALTYGIKLMDVQERCEVYLTWHFNITDYVDYKYITSPEHARKLLEEIEVKKPKNEVNSKVDNTVNKKEVISTKGKAEEIVQNEVSDFEHLKEWKENTDLDYYLSEEHWNYHVNSLLYKNLLVFHEKELGAFLDVSSDSFTQPIKDYTSLYGVLFNEAYRLCYKVITTPVPETKVANFAHQAATWKFRDLKDEDGNPIELVPNVTDLIESYHILGMANAILTISNVQKKAVNEFLIALSVYNDNGMYFCGNIHRFEQYYETYEALILANMVNGTMLRPGYDNVSRDKYLRKNVPWYEHLASKLEKEKQKEKDERTASIQEQNNNDSVVINGPVKDCTFIMTAATPTSKQKQKPKVVKPKTNTRKKPSGKPLTLKYYTHGNNGVLMRQRKRVHQVFKMWNRWGWIDEQTAIEDFDAFFEGVPKHCNITWTGNNTTILTIMLQELLKQSYFEEQTGCAARSLVEQQFGKTANSDRTRLDTDMEEKINLTLFVLDPQNHDLIFQSSDDLSEVEDIQDAALIEIFSGKLRSTKGI
ncbi:MAG: hypothetical protein IKM77_03760 [Prevotella sp.]|nr:hypothetical protein [Prevotella sp.]